MNAHLVLFIILALAALVAVFVAGKRLAHDLAVVLLDRGRPQAAVPVPSHDEAPGAVGRTRTEEGRS